MANKISNPFTLMITLALVSIFAGQNGFAQDSIFLKNKKKVSGKITATNPLGIEITSNGNKRNVAAKDIRKISYGSQPSQLERAKTQFDNGRFEDCLAELKKIKDNVSSPFVKKEIAFLTAYSNAQIAMQGGSVTANDAGKMISGFVRNNADSHHLYPATEMLGKIFIAIKKPGLAQAEFAKLANSKWPEYQAIGHFYSGESLLMANKMDEAGKSYEALSKVNANDPMTQELKLIGNCQRAKVMGAQGKADQAIKVLQGIIKNENPDNKKLFAYAYNALGATYLKQEKYKDAALSYLHTELLFSSEPDPHAEALYYLTEIWPRLEQTDRANRAQKLLRSRYRNSRWAK